MSAWGVSAWGVHPPVNRMTDKLRLWAVMIRNFESSFKVVEAIESPESKSPTLMLHLPNKYIDLVMSVLGIAPLSAA